MRLREGDDAAKTKKEFVHLFLMYKLFFVFAIYTGIS